MNNDKNSGKKKNPSKRKNQDVEESAELVPPPRSRPSESGPARWEPPPAVGRLLQTVRSALGTILDAADAAAAVIVQRFGRRA